MTTSAKVINRPKGQRWKIFCRQLWKQRYLMLFVIPALLYMILIKFVPIAGLQIAFKEYKFKKGVWGSPWADPWFKWFQMLARDTTLIPAIINTVGISALKILVCFPLPIVFAILLNEVRSTKFKRVVQTISYFPHFSAYSVVALILSNILSRTGLVNSLLIQLGLMKEPYIFLGEKGAFWWIAVFTDVWKTTGWNSIIYFSALTAIPLEQYEAATIDGASRFQKMAYITLPGLKPTILMLFIMKIGSLVNGASFDLSYLLGNTLNASRSDILSTYILKTGISQGRFSYATALGLIESCTMLLLVVTANGIVNKVSGEGLF